jgi:hypothetical protein
MAYTATYESTDLSGISIDAIGTMIFQIIGLASIIVVVAILGYAVKQMKTSF